MQNTRKPESQQQVRRHLIYKIPNLIHNTLVKIHRQTDISKRPADVLTTIAKFMWYLFLTDFDGVNGHQQCQYKHHRHYEQLSGVELINKFAHVQQSKQRHDAS